MSELVTAASDFRLTDPERKVIVTEVLADAKRRASGGGRRPPKVQATELAQALTGVQITSQISAAPSVVLSLADEGGRISCGSDLFDADEDGRLDPLALTYPSGSRYHYVLGTVSPQGLAESCDATFYPRIVDAMQHTDRRDGPHRWKRGTATRAEVLQTLVKVAAAKHGFNADLYCRYLDRKQPIAKESEASTGDSKKQKDGKAHKTLGISSEQDLTVNGKPMTESQKNVANIAINAADKKAAPFVVAQAMIYAGMGEHDLSPDDTWQNGSSDSTAVEAEAWLVGGRGFQGGGGLGVHKAHPEYTAWQIANAVESNASWLGWDGNPKGSDSYALHAFNPSGGGVGQAKALDEAAAIVRAGGVSGGTSETFEEVQPYFFTVGTSDNPHETYWDAFVRMVGEVAWAYAIDGDRVYYDSQPTLARQKVAAVLKRQTPVVVDWNYDYNSRHIATQMTVTVICEPLAFVAGDAVDVEGFGAASYGSTIKIPGRWLVSQAQRSRADLSTVLTLAQPAYPKKEPAPTVKTVTVAGSSSSLDDVKQLSDKSAARALAAAQVLSNMKVKYPSPDSHYAGSNADNTPGPLDCSSSTSWVLYHAGMLDGADPLVASDFESWGDPGPGNEMTVWASSGHVFIEFKVKGTQHQQINTVQPGAENGSGDTGPRLEPWSYSNQDAGAGAAAAGFVPRHYPGT